MGPAHLPGDYLARVRRGAELAALVAAGRLLAGLAGLVDRLLAGLEGLAGLVGRPPAGLAGLAGLAEVSQNYLGGIR